MKKLLILILIALLLTLNIYIIVNGLQLGSITVLGLKQIGNKNEELDTKINEATKLASTDYPKSLSNINDSIKKLENEKKNYEDIASINTDENIQHAKQFEHYKIETLWVKLGNHATSEGVTIKLDILKGNNNIESTYNLNFTVNGSYIGITDFISSIENDSSLGFKIEDFKMIPNTDTSDLQATFVCKDIYIEDISELTTTQNTQQSNTTDTNVTNTTNTTNTTSK